MDRPAPAAALSRSAAVPPVREPAAASDPPRDLPQARTPEGDPVHLPEHRRDQVDPEGQVPPPSVPAARRISCSAAGSERRARRCRLVILVAADVLALALATSLAYLARTSAGVVGPLDRAHDLAEAISQGAWLIALGWLLAIWLFGGYDQRLVPSGSEMYRNTLHATVGAAGIVGLILYLTNLPLSRVFFIVLFAVGPALLLLNRLLLRRALGYLRRHGRLRSPVLAIGAMPFIDSIARTVHRESWLGYDVVGAVVPDGNAPAESSEGIPVVGRESDLIAVVTEKQPAVLLFAAGTSSTEEEFRRNAWQLEDLGVEVIVVPGLSEVAKDRMTMRPVAGLPLVHLDLPRSREAGRLSKRVFDVAIALGALIAASPVLALIALVIRLQDGGPVLHRQQRVGRDGAPFTLLKFRSMVPDAELRLADLAGDLADRGNAVMFKMADDPRVTRFGRLLRRYSLDELPQLVNVLRGEMSIVGPRPALPIEVETYGRDAMRRLTVRPGITGLWQVSGRSDLSWEETVRLDLYYVDNWSFMQDAQIMIRTVKAVLSTSGAY